MNSFLRHFLVYGLAGAATRLAAVVLVPLYTRTLSLTDYGALEVLLAVQSLMTLVAGMQLESAVARDFYAESGESSRGQLTWVTTWLTGVGAMAVAVCCLVASRLGWLPLSLDKNGLVILLLLTFPAQMFGVQLVLLRFGGRSVAYAVLSFADLAIAAGSSAWLIVGLHLGINGALLGMLLGKLVCMSVAWPITVGKPMRVQLYGALARRLLSYGIPSLPATLIGWLQNAGSRLLLAVALTLSDVAIAGVAVKVAAIYSFVIYSFRLAWEPFSIAKLESFREDPRIYHRALEWYVASMFLVFGMATLVSPQIVQILAPPRYAAAGQIAVLFLMGQFWTGMTNVLVIGIHGARRTGLLMPVYGWGAVVNVALLFSLAPVLGVGAAGVGFLAASITSALLARHYSNRHFNTGFTTRLICWTLLVSIGFVSLWSVLTAHLSLHSVAGAWELFGAGALLLLTALVLIVSKAFEPGRGFAMWIDFVSMLRGAWAAR